MKTKKSEKQLVKCLNCEKATLMKWDNDPVVSHCAIKGFQVANTVRICDDYIKSVNKEIVKLTRKRFKINNYGTRI